MADAEYDSYVVMHEYINLIARSLIYHTLLFTSLSTCLTYSKVKPHQICQNSIKKYKFSTLAKEGWPAFFYF